MWYNYFKTAIRSFWRHKRFSFINLAGLTVGLCCGILIFLWAKDELSYDRFHPDADRIYGVFSSVKREGGEITTYRTTPYPLANVLESDFPEVELAVNFSRRQAPIFRYEDKVFKERGYYVHPSVFEMFSIPLLIGDPPTALADIHSMVISEDLAEKYFGKDWQAAGSKVLGQIIRTDNRQDFQITGVFQNLPSTSTLQFDFLIPIAEMIQRWPKYEKWSLFSHDLFVKLKEGTDAIAFEEKISQLIQERRDNKDLRLPIQLFTDMYLHSEYEGKADGGRIAYVRLFMLVAIFILMIASINFMNLTTARSTTRAREIGIRKVVGANRAKLIVQFLSESLLITAISAVLAILLIELLLPSFNELTAKSIDIDYSQPNYWLILLTTLTFTGLLAGIYPALLLSSFNTVSILKGTINQQVGGGLMRKGLVVVQFVMSVLLICGTLVVYHQLNYIKNKNIGLDRENVAYVHLRGNARSQYQSFKNELLQQAGLLSVTASNQSPISVSNSTTTVDWNGKSADEDVIFHAINVDYGFLETLKISLKEGRRFSKEFSTDSVTYIVNETAVRIMNMEDPIGQRFELRGVSGSIIGVVEDFHISSMYDPIKPVVLSLKPSGLSRLYVKISGEQMEEGIAGLQKVYEEFSPDYPFSYTFMDESYERMYKSESMIGKLANYFAAIAIFISCLGLLGLSVFTTEQRTKELGIRKVLGASEHELLLLIGKDVTILVILALLIALPISYYALGNWLDQYAYHADLNVSIFLTAGLLAILIAWLTIAYQVYKAARVNPVVSLRMD